MPTWPINALQYDAISIAPLEQRAVFTPDFGAPKTVRLDRRAQHSVRFDALMTGAELQDLMTWWEVDLALGSLEFTGLEDVVIDQGGLFKFDGIPEFMVLRGALAADQRLWRVPIALWQVSRVVYAVRDGADRVLDGVDVVVDFD